MAMITDNKVATIDYKLTIDDGTIVDSGNSYAYLHGMNNILIGMENALTGKSSGDEVQVDISADQAFGDKQDFEPLQFHRRDFGQSFDKLQVGMGLKYKDQNQNDVVLYVTKVLGSYATLTINHPLAGKTLTFQATVRSIRDATPAEIQSGFPHSQDGSAPSCGCC